MPNSSKQNKSKDYSQGSGKLDGKFMLLFKNFQRFLYNYFGQISNNKLINIFIGIVFAVILQKYFDKYLFLKIIVGTIVLLFALWKLFKNRVARSIVIVFVMLIIIYLTFKYYPKSELCDSRERTKRTFHIRN
jgi:hypothetical protein